MLFIMHVTDRLNNTAHFLLNMSQRKQFYSVFALVFIVILLFRAAGLYTDYLWFKALNYERIFLVNLEAQLLLFFAAATFCFLAIAVNLYLSYKFRKASGLKNIFSFKTKMFIALLVSYLVGSGASTKWLEVLQYFRQSSFNVADPVFGLDASFYVFSLPLINSLIRYGFLVLIIVFVFVILDYFQTMISGFFQQRAGQVVQINVMEEVKKLKKRAIVHIALLISLFFVLLAVSHAYGKYSVMHSIKGIVVGAGYADIVAYLPAVRILMFSALFVAVFTFFWLSRTGMKRRNVLAYVVGGYLVISFVGLGLVPNLVQTFRVSPNELNLEKPYIENNIEFTRIAYGLDDVQVQDFRADQKVSREIIDRSEQTVENIRILDWRPLIDTYKQTQEIRLYYDLSGVDIDRYEIEGKHTQVMLAAREMDQASIADNAKTWVNLHLVYTHGYGVVMSPVNSVTEQGLPNYIIQDIPPVYNKDEESIRIDNPRIYYGEMDNDYVIVNTGTNEFDYPKGESNEYNNYDGEGGIMLDNFFKKLLMAFRFTDIKILLSSDIDEESKIMYNRAITERIGKLTPFLMLDQDPYLVIADGQLYWMQDAYTMSGNFPYSEKFQGINYIRNPVKIVVDAYDGEVTYFIVDEDEPIMKTYSKIFYNQFKSIDEMPESLKEHIRYPEDLFRIQSEIYSTYHMDDATVFYNKEDAWDLPLEIYGTGQQVTVDPYYNILKLPDEDEEEFVLMISFTPIKKDNMVAWLAARSDDEEYGKLLLYRFPKDKLVYGPSQIEARIDQDSEISQQLTLWSQQGSRVTRGNLLVIPIENSLLYVEPLYIQSEKGQLPELKRVLLSDGDKVVMEVDLATALDSLLGIRRQPAETNTTGDNLPEQANQYYEKILESMQNQDWSGIGDNLDKLGEIIEAMLD